MSRYIDADKLMKDGWSLKRTKYDITSDTYEVASLDCVPTADVRENVKGEWIVGDNSLTCPICGAHGEDIRSDFTFNYCPNCGADMRGEA